MNGARMGVVDWWMQVIVSSHNSLGDGRYFDVENSSSFEFDHTTQVCHGGSGMEDTI